MKKSIIVFFASILLLSSCILSSSDGKLIHQTDSFRNAQTVSLRLRFNTEEKHSSIYGIACDFYAEKVSVNKQYKVFTTVLRTESSFSLEDSFFLAIDDKIYHLAKQKTKIQTRSSVSETTGNVMLSDSTTATVVTGVSTSTWKEEQFVIQFSDEQVTEILKANKLLFRFYAGSSIGTSKVQGSDLEKIKKLLSTF